MKKRIRFKYYFNISKRDKFLISLLFVLICTFLIFKYINNGIKNVLSVYAENEVTRVSTMIINNAIDNMKQEDYKNYVDTVKNKDDEIISVDFNTKEINRNLVLLNNEIYEKLLLLENGKYAFFDSEYVEQNDLSYKVPLGLITGNAVLSNLGPRIPFKAKILGNVVSNIRTDVTPYGINNSLLKVYIDVTVSERFIMPFISNDIKVNSSVLLVVKIINGRVPNVYGGGYSVTSPLNSSN